MNNKSSDNTNNSNTNSSNNIKIIQLSTGVNLILDHMDGVRSSCIGIWCKTGSSNERPEEEGISHFIEHMVFKGTSNRTAFEIVDEIDSVGGDINAFTGKESTCFYVKCLDEHLMKACDVLVDLIENPLFSQEDIDKEKLVVIEEINMSADDPDDVAAENLAKLVFSDSTLSHPVLGSKDNVSSFTSADLRKYYDEHYTRDSIVVSIAGSFDEAEIISYFEGKFHNLKPNARKDEKGCPVNACRRETIYKDIEQAHLILGITTVPVIDEARYKLSVLSVFLGGGMSSRLFQNVREQKGLAYSVYSSNSFYISGGAFAIAAGVAKNKVDEALDAIKQELDRLQSEPVAEKEFLSAKEQLKSSYIFSQESAKSRMKSNGNSFLARGKCLSQDDILTILDDISLADIEEVKNLITNFDNYSIVNVTGK